MKTKKTAILGMFAAISIAGVFLIHFPIFPQVAFLEYDPADIPIFIGTFAFGTVEGLLLTIAVSLIQGVTVSSGSGMIGVLMHILATGSFVLTAGGIYSKKKTRSRAYVALFSGVVVMVTVMTLWNLIITPIYMGVPRSDVISLLPLIIVFNAIKAGVNAVLTALLYKRVHKTINKFLDK